MEEPKIGFCTNADGIRIAYTTFGQGPALVCTLDFGFSIKDITQFPIMMSSIEKGSRYHTIVAYDHSGTGLSGRNRTDFTLAASARDLESVINHLKLEKVILYGMSGGGPIAMDYAARHPQNISHLVLFNTSAYYDMVTTEPIRDSMVSLYKNRFDFAMRGALNLMFPGASTAFTESLIKMLVDNVTPDTYAQYWEKFSEFDVRNILPRIHTPTLVIHRKGYFIPMQAGVELASLIHNARFVQLEEDQFEPARRGYASYERAILEFLGDPVTDIQEATVAQPEVKQSCHDVFISFAYPDKEDAAKIYTYLKSSGINAFWCEDLSAGQDYPQLLGAAIRDSKSFLLVVSDYSDNSDTVRKETTIAHNNKKTIIPVRIKNMLPKNLEYLTANSLFFDAFPQPLDQYLPRLTKDIKKIMGSKADEMEHASLEFQRHPVRNSSTDNAGKAVPLSHLKEPEPGQKKGAWLHLSNPLVYFTVILLATVMAGIILMFIKC